MIHCILQFIQAKGAGDAALKRMLLHTVNYGQDAVDNLCSSEKALVAELGVKLSVAENIVKAKKEALIIAEELESHKIGVVWMGSVNYPERLSKILQMAAPPVLFFHGNSSLLSSPCVGFCGSRKASEKGIGITERCALQLAQDKICIVSGYAKGVDLKAHKTALEHVGTTIFVMPEGILRLKHKPEIIDLLRPSNHLVVSQFPPRLTWLGRNAMKRNSTIIGLSDAMILVESGLKGGTFAAGKEALKRKRPLFVIDYAEPDSSAQANPYFIKFGGMPLRGNKQGIPNVDKVKEAVEQKSWREISSKKRSLFDCRVETIIKSRHVTGT